MSSTSAGATQVSYAATFRSTNSLTPGLSTVTLTAPAGTVFPAQGNGNYSVFNPTTNAFNGNEAATVSASGTSVTIHVDVAVPAGETAVVTANAATNTATTGSQPVTLVTSSDPLTVTHMVNFTAPTSVGSPLLSVSSKSASATQVTYTASFVATNNLTAGFSTVTFTAPAGTVFPAAGDGNYAVLNTLTSAFDGNESATVSASGNSVTILTNVAALAGQRIVVTANAVSNTTTTGSQPEPRDELRPRSRLPGVRLHGAELGHVLVPLAVLDLDDGDAGHLRGELRRHQRPHAGLLDHHADRAGAGATTRC